MYLKTPKNTRKKKKSYKKCEEPGCNNVFFGISVAKYCEKHKALKNRLKKNNKAYKDDNLVIKHNHIDPVSIELECGLKGCCNKYKIILICRQYVYPKYCEEHRNRYKRESFNKKQI